MKALSIADSPLSFETGIYLAFLPSPGYNVVQFPWRNTKVFVPGYFARILQWALAAASAWLLESSQSNCDFAASPSPPRFLFTTVAA
jgi:hypothetical protein